MTDKNVWIEHDGGPCPVDKKTLVSVKFEDGSDDLDSAAIDAAYWSEEEPEACSWQYRDGTHGIIAYRVVQS